MEGILDYDNNSRGEHSFKNQKLEPNVKVIRGNGFDQRCCHWQNKVIKSGDLLAASAVSGHFGGNFCALETSHVVQGSELSWEAVKVSVAHWFFETPPSQ